MPNTQLTAFLLAGLITLSCPAFTQTGSASIAPASVTPASVTPANAAPLPEYLRAEVEQTFHSVNPQSIRATMSFLADDLIQGRQPGTRGFAIASRYIETRFMALGLQPGVDNKTYIQPVPLKKGVTVETQSSLTLEPATTARAGKTTAKTTTDLTAITPLVYGRDYFFSPNLVDPVSEITAPLVFIGFGVYAPELKYDDYQKTDVKGKIVVYFDGAPATFPSNERAYFSSAPSKYAEAVKRGAVGVLTVQQPAGQRSSWEATIRRVGQGTFRWADAQGQAQGAYQQLKVIGALNAEQSEKLLAGSAIPWQTIIGKAKAGQPQSFPLNTTASMKVTTTVSDIQGSNLIGIIPGSDPVLKNEYVVYAAHLDHFGIGAPLKGDSIYNGAHDNASGVSLLLEIAQAFRNLPVAPKRSVIIAVVTGEEYGLLGSDYFINNPTVSRKSIVANLALDMPFFFHPVLDIVPYGALHSSLSRQVETAARYMGLKIGPDPFPEQVVFIRSDHYSFIRKGIPSLFIKSGFMTIPSDTVDRSRSDVDWRRTTYHTPQDDMNQAFDFDAAATHVKLNFLIGLLICNDPARPGWNKEDFFGGRFTNSQ
jgi:Zn-dependent M28 family amino/carboxypeptidase